MADYKDTLNLPRTSFSMRAGLAKREPELLKFWDDIGLEKTLLTNADDRPLFVLHDGPPYANGDIHVGHTLNKVLKDIIVKHRRMTGYFAPYVPGWDCHGQPIEHQVEKNLGGRKNSVSQAELRTMCREYALKFVDRQKSQFKRLGVHGDWEKPYLTLDPVYEAANIAMFAKMYAKGLIYHGRKPIHWCYSCRTALAEAEIEYGDEPSSSIYVRFPVISPTPALAGIDRPLSFLVWTTTPWTLPANVAVAIHPKADYVVAELGDKLVIVAAALVGALGERFGQAMKKVLTVKGEDLAGATCSSPLFPENTSAVVTADFVALDQGSGCVHIAPGHGAEDYVVGAKNDLPSPMPVDDFGVFTAEAGKYAGLHVTKANSVITRDLDDAGLLVLSEEVSHSYPHCWRCKKPVIFRATKQWFVSMDEGSLRSDALAAIEDVSWIPGWNVKRITGMVRDRPDWCISRQRAWGVPIPVLYCTACGETIAGQGVLAHIEELFRKRGADVWFTSSPNELLPAGYTCPKCGTSDFNKENDILDVWFESGVSHQAVLKTRPELHWPAELYLEGSDQHRGWFQSSLLTSVAATGKAPYKTVLTHGFLVDGQGRKMSKSLGNVVDPLKVADSLGADILRLWVSSADYSSDIAISDEILQRTVEAYRRLRNTFRFLLGNLDGFDPGRDAVLYADLAPVDKWALMRLHQVTGKALGGYDSYRFYNAFQSLYGFATVDLSALYLDIIKDRLYVSAPRSSGRRAAQTVLFDIFYHLVRLLAPILSFTCEEVWQLGLEFWEGPLSVHLAAMPEVNDDFIDVLIEREWERILTIRAVASKALEEARALKLIGNSLEARLLITLPADDFAILRDHEAELPEIFIVSAVQLQKGDDVAVKVDVAPGSKCGRCWTYKTDVGSDELRPDLCGRCLEAITGR